MDGEDTGGGGERVEGGSEKGWDHGVCAGDEVEPVSLGKKKSLGEELLRGVRVLR